MGYRARNNSQQIGFVTSGHIFTSVDGAAYVNSVLVGRCQYTKLADNLDAAFIRITNTSYQPTNTVDVTNQTLVNVTTPVMGNTVTLRGINGTYSGSILETSAGAYSSTGGVYIRDLIKVSAVTTGGDSGGIMYTGSSILGVIKAVGGGNTYVVKATNINSTFNLTIY